MNTPANIKQDPARVIATMIQQNQKQITLALPRTVKLNTERMQRIALTEMRRVPALQRCEPLSFLGAIIVCAQLGLEPGNGLGHIYLIPFGSEVTVVLGYRGMIELARRSGQIISIGAYAVHEGDEFDYEFGLDPTIKHRPSQNAEPGALTHVYAVAKLKDGGTQFELMNAAQIEAVRRRSKSGGSGPWKDHYEEMARKTVIRRLFKYLPVSIEMACASQVDDKETAIDITNFETGEPLTLDTQQVQPTTPEVKAHRRKEALAEVWAEVIAAKGDPEKLINMSESQIDSAPEDKQEKAIIFLREWLKSKGKT